MFNSVPKVIFGKIVTIQQLRNVDYKDVFWYPQKPVPWSIAHGSDDLIKTSKSALMTELENGAADVDVLILFSMYIVKPR